MGSNGEAPMCHFMTPLYELNIKANTYIPVNTAGPDDIPCIHGNIRSP